MLPAERIRGVETGACPHAAIREDASMNLQAIAELEDALPGLELIFVESGGDNLAAAFSPELVDIWIYVIDVAEGDKIPRKGGPGIMRSDLLVINKIDLAPYVGASLEVMDRDSRRMRGERPFHFHESARWRGTGSRGELAGGKAASPGRRAPLADRRARSLRGASSRAWQHGHEPQSRSLTHRRAQPRRRGHMIKDAAMRADVRPRSKDS